DVILAEQETTEEVPDRFFAHWLSVEHDRERRPADGKLLVGLRIVADFDVNAGLEPPLEGWNFADQRLEQGRLAGAVRSNQADLVAALDQQVLRLDEHRVLIAGAIADGQRSRGETLGAAAQSRLDSDRQLGMILRPLNSLHPLEACLPA